MRPKAHLNLILPNPQSHNYDPQPQTQRVLCIQRKALALLDRTHILTTLHTAITNLTRKTSPAISLNLGKKDSQHIDNNASYTYPYPDILDPTQRPPHLPLRPFRATWNPDSFIYTDGSKKTGNPTLGASVVNQQTQTTTHIDIES